MGAIVIRTRYDEGTESAEVVTSIPCRVVHSEYIFEKSRETRRLYITLINFWVYFEMTE